MFTHLNKKYITKRLHITYEKDLEFQLGYLGINNRIQWDNVSEAEYILRSDLPHIKVDNSRGRK